MKNIYLLACMLLGLFVFFPATSTAATFEGGDIYTLSKGEVVEDNLYVGAGDLTLSGRVEGDLHAAGGTLVVSGDITDDIAIAGGDVSVLGTVGGDARIAGGNLLIDSLINGDLLVAGGAIKTLDTTTIGKDVSLFGGYIIFNGTAEGDAVIAGGEIIIDGTIRGDVEVNVDEKLTLGKNARIDGVLLYKASSEEVLEAHELAVVSGGVMYEGSEKSPMSDGDFGAILTTVFAVLSIVKILALIVAAIVLVLVFKRFSQSVVSRALGSFWAQVLRGFIVLIVVPVAIFLSLITIFGIYIALVLLAVYSLFLMFAGIYSGVLFGAWLVKLIGKKEKITVKWWHALIGVLLLGIMAFAPVIGWLIGFAFMLAALGTLFDMFTKHVWSNR